MRCTGGRASPACRSARGPVRTTFQAASRLPAPVIARPLAQMKKQEAKPGAKNSQVTDIGEESIGVQIGAKAVDGEANEELIDYMSEVLRVRKRVLSLSKASAKSRTKVLILSNDPPVLTIDEALERLRAAMA